jgi:hypothetical protein
MSQEVFDSPFPVAPDACSYRILSRKRYSTIRQDRFPHFSSGSNIIDILQFDFDFESDWILVRESEIHSQRRNAVPFQLIESSDLRQILIQFMSVVHLIQMSLMKMADKMKNVHSQQFEHWNKSE